MATGETMISLNEEQVNELKEVFISLKKSIAALEIAMDLLDGELLTEFEDRVSKAWEQIDETNKT